MRFRMLGPVRVFDGAGWVPVPARQPRLVLAVLLTEAGQVVSTERLVDEVWGDRPPRTGYRTIHTYVLRLRRLLPDGGAQRLVTRHRGYELVVGDGELDAWEFERQLGVARQALAGGQTELAVARLAEALALWQGPVLADVPASPSRAARVAQLEQARLAAIEDRLAGLLELGRAREMIDELARLVHEQPLRERLWALLMRAQHRCGRRAEALASFQQARRVLREELGLEPGAELRQAQQEVLTDRLPVPAPASGQVAPAQLPAGTASFTGRRATLTQLDALLANQHAAGTPLVCLVGAAGAGKTALAVHWARRVADRFPDGQLYVDMRGFSGGPPVQPVEALGGFLRSLGVPAAGVPVELAEAAALYRSLLASRRVLVLADNARDPDQVRPLLPASPGCLVLVTSRDRLTGLVARDDAARLAVDPLTEAEAQALLARLLGADRTRAEPAAVAELAARCGHLPLAVRIAAANLAAHAGWNIAAYLDRIRHQPLAALQVDSDPQAAVRTAFDHSYAALPAQVRQLFRRIGLVPGPDVTPPAAAALVAGEPTEAQRLLDRLASAHLVDEHHPHRYALHDLLRSYAAERAVADERPSDREAAWHRLGEHYLRLTEAAVARLEPSWNQLPGAARPGPGAEFDDQQQALAWLAAERTNLVAIVHHAAEQGPYPTAWRLADALRRHLHLRMYLVDWLVVGRAGLAAAERDGYLPAQTAAHLSLGMLRAVQGRHQQSVDHQRAALTLARKAEWPQAEAVAVSGLGHVALDQGRFREGAEHYRQALAIARRTGQLHAEQANLMNLGVAHYGMGEFQRAAHCYTKALALARRNGSRVSEGRTLGNLGDAYRQLGRPDDALAVLTQAQAIHQEVGDRFRGGDTLRALAAVHREAGRLDVALDLARSAVELAKEVGDRWLRAAALVELASGHNQLGRHSLATDTYRQALDLARRTGNRYGQAEALVGLATAARAASQPGQAARYAREALDLARPGGYQALVTAARALAGDP